MVRKPVVRITLLVFLAGLVLIPPVVTGYANLRQAEMAYRDSDFLRAGEAYEQAAVLLPWQPELWDRAGLSQIHEENYPEARRMFETAKQREALSDAGWDGLGLSYYEMGDLRAAVDAWNTGSREYPSYTGYSFHLGQAYRELGNTPAEIGALEKWVAKGGESDAWAHYRLGILLAVSNPERAIQEYLLASSLDSAFDPVADTMKTALNLAGLERDESRRLVIVGRGLGLVDEWSLAHQAFSQAVAADGQNAQAWAWLGEAEQQLGRDGREQLDMALQLGAEDPLVHSLRGIYWTRQGQFEQALWEYQLASEYDPGNPAWQISIGEAYSNNGDLQYALESFINATEMDPANAVYWRLLAEFCARYDVQVAEIGLPAAQMAVELTGEDPLALDTLGWVLLLLQQYNEAQDSLEHALNLDPELASGYFHLGILAMQLDEWDSGRDYLLQARDLDKIGTVGGQAQILLDQYFP
jgi:tetratricopeptide (TPR) repeat protein